MNAIDLMDSLECEDATLSVSEEWLNLRQEVQRLQRLMQAAIPALEDSSNALAINLLRKLTNEEASLYRSR